MIAYFLRITMAGMRKLVSAENGGPRMKLATIVVGDGGGEMVPPDEMATKLVNENYSAPINDGGISDADPTIVLAEGVIPANVGGFTIRQIGIRDDAGTLVAIGSFPETYKPLSNQGATREMIIRVALKVGNADLVQFMLDPSMILVTRTWALANLTPAKMLPGGTTGQVLTKKSNADGDMGWQGLAAAVNIVVDVIEEVQIAVASQTVFNLTKITTEGAAVYVDGKRIDDFARVTLTRIQLAQPLAAGQRVLFVQNEPNEAFKFKRQIIALSFYLNNT